jgi:hypothetical protein
MTAMARAFRIHADDNVAVLLDDCAPGRVEVLGAGGVAAVAAVDAIKSGHKLALVGIEAGQPIVKYGQRIGHATRPIEPGQWVHLHNCASDYDERSATLDGRTGAPTDTRYE